MRDENDHRTEDDARWDAYDKRMDEHDHALRRADWRSMFVFDPATRLVRLVGGREHAAEMFARRERYRALACSWVAGYLKEGA